MDSFSQKLPNGKYLVKLYFAETFEGINGPGQRVFSYKVQDKEFKDFDIWVKAGGPNRAYIETVPVEVTNGELRIVFTSKIENPEINAIEIIPQSAAENSAMVPASGSQVSGVWQAQFDTQRGLQQYTFALKQDGRSLTGTASVEVEGEKRESELKEGKVEGDTVTFSEPLNIQGNDFSVTFTGKVSANEIKFTRQVGEFGSSEAVAKSLRPPLQHDRRTATSFNSGNSAPANTGADGALAVVEEAVAVAAAVRSSWVRTIKPAFDDPPAGFNDRRDNIAHGEIKVVQYDSKSLGTRRQLRVYTPPGYTADKKYPVLYLLHGIGGNDLEWIDMETCRADIVLDNLLADGKIQPMVVVFPNGNSTS